MLEEQGVCGGLEVGFDPRHVVSLSKTYSLVRSTGNTQEFVAQD